MQASRMLKKIIRPLIRISKDGFSQNQEWLEAKIYELMNNDQVA